MRKLIYLILPLLFSCEVNLNTKDIETSNQLVVNALLNDVDPVAVSVSKTLALGDSILPAPISNAVVSITDENNVTTILVWNGFTKLYESALILQKGKFYRIRVKAPGFIEAFSSLRVPTAGNSSAPTWKDSASFDKDGFPLGEITMQINDNGNEANNYRISLEYWDPLPAEWRRLKAVPSDGALSQVLIETEDGSVILRDGLFNGRLQTLKFITPFGFASQTPKFRVTVENLNEEYYNYFNSLENYTNGSGVFSEPSPVYSNIENGVGIFAASSVRRDVIN